MQIFLSYTAEDKNIAEPIAFSLRARGHKVFFDRDDLPPGGEYDMRIEKAVERSALFVFLLSPASIAKGRFTLTELEFARRKWRKADGHVLPVMIKPVEFEAIPNFLKSVTILEPKGNAAAEVAVAVEPLAQSAAGGQMLVYGALGVVSGFLTFRLRDVFTAILEPRGLNFSIHEVNIALELSGTAFAAALAGGFAYYFRFKPSQMLILPFVLAGWFLAMQIVIWGSPSHAFLDSQQAARCTDSEESVDCLKYQLHRVQEKEATQQDFLAWMAAGAAGAAVTAVGVPLATQRIFSFIAILSTTLAGALIALAWVALTWLTGLQVNDAIFTCFLIAWQAGVAGVIGRSIR